MIFLQVKNRLVKIMQRIHAESVGHEADFDCMPENVDSIDTQSGSAAAELGGGTRATPLMGSFNVRRSADCRDWKPEMPELLGLYHAYVKGYNKDTRQHKLFIIVSGGCHMLSDKFYNLSVDVRNNMTVDEVLESEEAYFLRRYLLTTHQYYFCNRLDTLKLVVLCVCVQDQREEQCQNTPDGGRCIQAQDSHHDRHLWL